MKYKRLSAQKHRQIIRCFCADITATACAEIVGVNRNTVNSWYNEFRHKILLAAIAETRAEGGEFEVDESYFGARRVRGKRGHGLTATSALKLCYVFFYSISNFILSTTELISSSVAFSIKLQFLCL